MSTVSVEKSEPPWNVTSLVTTGISTEKALGLTFIQRVCRQGLLK